MEAAYATGEAPTGQGRGKADLLATLVGWVDLAEEATVDARKDSERYRDYYDGKQLTAEEIKELKKRGQPRVIMNRVKRKVDFLVGFEMMKRTDPKAFPRNPGDEKAAEAATDAIRYVCENNDFDAKRSRVWENLLIEGAGGVEVTVRPKSRKGRNHGPLMGSTYLTGVENFTDYEIVINHYAWDRIGWDPASTEPDFSDARYKYAVVWKDYDEALAKWPNAREALDGAMKHSTNEYGETYDDKPRHLLWADSRRKRIKVVLIYYRSHVAGWSWALMTAGGFITGGVSPYVDENDDPECPLIFISAYIDRDNDRYGIVRDMISPQDEVNKRRSKLLHMLTMRQVKYEDGAVQDERQAKQELAKPDGFIKVAKGMGFEVLPQGDQAVGQFQLLAEAQQEMDLIGPNAAMQGRSGEEASGRAILASQQGGQTEAAMLMDRLRQFNREVYRQIWNRVRQYWTEERWVRVTDDENKIKFVGLNRKVTAGEAFQTTMRQQGANDQDIQREMQAVQMDPRRAQIAGQVVGIENPTSEIDVDILVEDAPDTVTLQAEQFEALVRLAEAGVPIPPDVLIQAAPNLRNKQAILDRMTGGEQSPEEAQMQQVIQQLGLRRLVAQVMNEEAGAQKTAAEVKETAASAFEKVTQGQENLADAKKTMREPPPDAMPRGTQGSPPSRGFSMSGG